MKGGSLGFHPSFFCVFVLSFLDGRHLQDIADAAPRALFRFAPVVSARGAW